MTEVQLKQIKKVDIYPKLRDRRTDIFYFMEYSTNIFTRFVLEFEFYVLREHLARQNEGYSNGWSRRGEWERQWKKEREREREREMERGIEKPSGIFVERKSMAMGGHNNYSQNCSP